MFYSNDFGSPTDNAYYIGLEYNQKTSRYEWNHDTPLSSDWDNWNPGSQSTTDLCSVVNAASGWLWESVDCSNSYYAICEYGVRKSLIMGIESENAHYNE